MAIIIKVIPVAQFNQQLSDGIKSSIPFKIATRTSLNSSIIKTSIGNLLSSIFNTTDVANALRGNHSTDLPAHLGLTGTQANGLVDGMNKIIKNSINLITKTNDKIVISIMAVPSDVSVYQQLPGARYVSSPSLILIPVIDWLLVNPDIDIGQAAYDIVFKGELGANIDSRIQHSSRSGRAIMMKLEALNQTGGGYMLPDIVRGNLGQNFLEFAIRQPSVAKAVAKILIDRIK